MARPRKTPTKNVRVAEDIYEAAAKQAYQEGRYISDHINILLQIGLQYYRPAIPKKRGRSKPNTND